MSITVKKIKSIKPVVRFILAALPDTRDDDKLLILKVWRYQNRDLVDDNFSFKMFAIGFLDNKYADVKSIIRSRRLLQAEYVELQGENYKLRKKEGEDTAGEINN